MHPFVPRRREYHGVERRGGWRIKRYSISLDGELPDEGFAPGNELPLRVFLRDASGWRAARGSESVCVWDLEIVAFERDAYVQTVLAEGRAEDVARYLERGMPAQRAGHTVETGETTWPHT